MTDKLPSHRALNSHLHSLTILTRLARPWPVQDQGRLGLFASDARGARTIELLQSGARQAFAIAKQSGFDSMKTNVQIFSPNAFIDPQRPEKTHTPPMD